ncbi:hypothetical protein BC629DRAFT_1598971 [Irpex lacteus]|nr:hypothetical protein BC629DRAFT_1598971 [Irpex lacteus]
MSMEFPDPWYLTVVSTQGIQFLRPERSWRPIVGVTVVDHDRTHETVLGCDGRNPNLKAPIELHEVHHASRLEIKVWHQSHTKKSKRKRYLVGSVFLTLGDLVRRQDKPTSNIPLTLKCPPMRKRSPTVTGSRQLNCAMIVLRLTPPSPPTSPTPSSSRAPNYTSDYEEHVFSEDETLGALASPTLSADETTHLLPPPHPHPPSSTLRRRKRTRRKRKEQTRAYHVHTTDEESSFGSDEEEEEECPPTPPPACEPHTAVAKRDDEDEFDVDVDEIYNITFTSSPSFPSLPSHPSPSSPTSPTSPSYLDVCHPHTSPCPPPQPFTRLELILDSFSPYRELSHPQCDFGRVLVRLLGEWYAVGAWLLGVATLNAAVFGYSSGQDTTLFAMDGLALRSVTLGSITAAIGLVIDAWFLVLYSSGDVDRFRRLAADISSLSSQDADPTYFYFSIVCRLPAMCLFVSSCALMLFLLAVAWDAWPTAVLVMCFLAGILLTLQYLVFGAKRLIGGVVWVVKKVVGMISRPRRSGSGSGVGGQSRKGSWGGRKLRKNGGRLSVPPITFGRPREERNGEREGEGEREGDGRIERSDSLPPPPYSSPRPMAQELGGEARQEEGEAEEGIELGPSISRRVDS